MYQSCIGCRYMPGKRESVQRICSSGKILEVRDILVTRFCFTNFFVGECKDLSGLFTDYFTNFFVGKYEELSGLFMDYIHELFCQ